MASLLFFYSCPHDLTIPKASTGQFGSAEALPAATMTMRWLPPSPLSGLLT
jgi:hypothetical protein